MPDASPESGELHERHDARSSNDGPGGSSAGAVFVSLTGRARERQVR